MSKTKVLARMFNSGFQYKANEIKEIFNLSNPYEAIRQLRKQGYCIYANKRHGTVYYRLGKPTKSMVAKLAFIYGSDIFSK